VKHGLNIRPLQAQGAQKKFPLREITPKLFIQGDCRGAISGPILRPASKGHSAPVCLGHSLVRMLWPGFLYPVSESSGILKNEQEADLRLILFCMKHG